MSEPPISNLPWWKILVLPLLVYAPLSAVLTFIPPPSEPPWVEIAIGLVIFGQLPLVAARLGGVWWTAYALAGILTFQILLIGIRVWLIILPAPRQFPTLPLSTGLLAKPTSFGSR